MEQSRQSRGRERLESSLLGLLERIKLSSHEAPKSRNRALNTYTSTCISGVGHVSSCEEIETRALRIELFDHSSSHHHLLWLTRWLNALFIAWGCEMRRTLYILSLYLFLARFALPRRRALWILFASWLRYSRGWWKWLILSQNRTEWVRWFQQTLTTSLAVFQWRIKPEFFLRAVSHWRKCEFTANHIFSSLLRCPQWRSQAPFSTWR